jgi:spore germination protein YaaH
MQAGTEPRSVYHQQPPSKRRGSWLFTAIITIILSVSTLGAWIYWSNLPNTKETDPLPERNGIPVSYQGEWLTESAIQKDGVWLLPLPMLNLWSEPDLVWDRESEQVIHTTGDKVIRMDTEQLTAYVNEQPLSIRYPVIVQDGMPYVPLDPIASWLGIRAVPQLDGKMLRIDKNGSSRIMGTVIFSKQNDESLLAIREQPGISSPIVSYVKHQEEIALYGEKEGWYRIQKESGEIGYVDKLNVALGDSQMIQVEIEDRRPFLPWRPTGGKIHMTWEYVYRQTAKPDKIGNLNGVNVVSPTWFELIDEKGNISSKADLGYVHWAHQQGMQVWGLLSNGFDPDLTHQVLSDPNLRKHMTKQMLVYAEMYGLDGINLDFENVYLKDKDLLVQWVREAAPLWHEQNLVVSMDITIKSNSENWSMFYDRPKLAAVVDYLVLMAYDEHWASSPVAGSVASLPWVERGVRQLIDQEGISPAQIILGVPFYTRLWTEETIDGKTKVSSKAISMDKAKKIVQDQGLKPEFLEDIGQHYVTWTDGESRYHIWLENEASMQKRINLMQQYRLAGIASWRRGFEKEGFFPYMTEELEKRP